MGPPGEPEGEKMNNTTATLQTIQTHAEAIKANARKLEDSGADINPSMLRYIENATALCVEATEDALNGGSVGVAYLRPSAKNVPKAHRNRLAPAQALGEVDDAIRIWLKHNTSCKDGDPEYEKALTLISLGINAGAVNQRNWSNGR